MVFLERFGAPDLLEVIIQVNSFGPAQSALGFGHISGDMAPKAHVQDNKRTNTNGHAACAHSGAGGEGG